MKLTEKQRFRLEVAAENAGMEPRSYSGRAMFGRYCFAVVSDNPARLVQFGIELAQHPDADELCELVRGPMRWDSMGRDDTVYYWEFLQTDPPTDEDDDY